MDREFHGSRRWAARAAALAVMLALVSWLDGVRLSWELIVAGVIGMWAVGQVAPLVPAWRATRVSPAIATRNV